MLLLFACKQALPFVVNMVLLTRAIFRELREHEPFAAWFATRKNLVLLFMFLGSTNMECFAALFSRWFLSEAFNAPMRHESKARIEFYSLGNVLLEDAPQLVIQVLQACVAQFSLPCAPRRPSLLSLADRAVGGPCSLPPRTQIWTSVRLGRLSSISALSMGMSALLILFGVLKRLMGAVGNRTVIQAHKQVTPALLLPCARKLRKPGCWRSTPC
jgi:hypothetical protein